MSFKDYRGREVIIKSTSMRGKIIEVLQKRGSGGGLAVRFLIIDDNGAEHQLMPHEVNIQTK